MANSLNINQCCIAEYGEDCEYKAYLAKPETNEPTPGMIVIHEWWGLNDHIRDLSDKLALAGYTALAVDLFGKSTTDPQVAMDMVRELDQSVATEHLLCSADYLRDLDSVIPEKTGSIGWCFGGGQSLRLAIEDQRLAACVIYYGRPVTDPAELSRIKAPILGIYGEADEMIPVDSIREFDEALNRAGKEHEFHIYPGAAHAFANPSRGRHYDSDTAADAWKKTLGFLDRTLKGA